MRKREEKYTRVEEKGQIEKNANQKLTDDIEGEPKMMTWDCFTIKDPAGTYL